MPTEWVVVYTAAGQLEANLIKNLLAAAGISAQLSQESAGATLGLTVGPLGQVEVLVPEALAAEAEALLAAARRGDLAAGDDLPAGDPDSES